MNIEYSLKRGLVSSDSPFADYGKSATIESACEVNKAYPKKTLYQATRFTDFLFRPCALFCHRILRLTKQQRPSLFCFLIA